MDCLLFLFLFCWWIWEHIVLSIERRREKLFFSEKSLSSNKIFQNSLKNDGQPIWSQLIKYCLAKYLSGQHFCVWYFVSDCWQNCPFLFQSLSLCFRPGKKKISAYKVFSNYLAQDKISVLKCKSMSHLDYIAEHDADILHNLKFNNNKTTFTQLLPASFTFQNTDLVLKDTRAKGRRGSSCRKKRTGRCIDHISANRLYTGPNLHSRRPANCNKLRAS